MWTFVVVTTLFMILIIFVILNVFDSLRLRLTKRAASVSG